MIEPSVKFQVLELPWWENSVALTTEWWLQVSQCVASCARCTSTLIPLVSRSVCQNLLTGFGSANPNHSVVLRKIRTKAKLWVRWCYWTGKPKHTEKMWLTKRQRRLVLKKKKKVPTAVLRDSTPSKTHRSMISHAHVYELSLQSHMNYSSFLWAHF